MNCLNVVQNANCLICHIWAGLIFWFHANKSTKSCYTLVIAFQHLHVMAFMCIEPVYSYRYSTLTVLWKSISTFLFFVSISHTYMFQIVKETLILEKNNSIKYKTHFLNYVFVKTVSHWPAPGPIWKVKKSLLNHYKWCQTCGIKKSL